MPLSTRLLALCFLTPLALATSCAGPPIPAPIEGEPVCPDVEIGAGHSKMVGGLRYPVRMRVLDGKDVMMRIVMSGKRSAEAQPSRTFLVDDNAEYTVEWAQCVNEQAPHPPPEGPKGGPVQQRAEAAYECGEAQVYKTDKLVTKKGDAASHVITFAAPPKAECWQSEAPAAAPALQNAGAPDAGVDAGDDGGLADAGDDSGAASDAGAGSDAGETGKSGSEKKEGDAAAKKEPAKKDEKKAP